MTRKSHKTKKSSSHIAHDQRPRSLKYYLSGGSYHIKIGKYATKAYIHAKEFLAKELPVPSILKHTDNHLGETGAIVNAEEKISQKTEPISTDKSRQESESQSNDDVINDNDSLIVPDKGEKKQTTIEEIKKLTKRSNEVLCSAKTVFPFSLFPDHIVLDRTKLTITKRDFFFSAKVMSIRIEDVLNVAADVGPFLGSLTIAIRIMSSEDHITINYLPRKDTVHLKHVIQGYVIAQHNKIDVAHLNREELIETLADLGHDLNV